MIVTDLDRTLLRPDKTLSAYTVDVLHACQAKGLLVVFATARSEDASKRFVAAVQPDGLVSNGGALVRTGDKVVYRNTMDSGLISRLLRRLLDEPSVDYITVDAEDGYFVNKPVDESDPLWADYLPALPMDFSQGLASAAYAVAVEMADNAAAHAVAADFPEIAIIPFSGEGWYSYAKKGADKWSGVAALAAHLGIAHEEIVTFGDDFNDIEMLRHSGRGIAVANAIDEVKAVADALCAGNDMDGVARWLEDALLGS